MTIIQATFALLWLVAAIIAIFFGDLILLAIINLSERFVGEGKPFASRRGRKNRYKEGLAPQMQPPQVGPSQLLVQRITVVDEFMSIYHVVDDKGELRMLAEFRSPSNREE